MEIQHDRPTAAYLKLQRIHPANFYDGQSLWRFVETAALSAVERGELVLQELPGFVGWTRRKAIDRRGSRILPCHYWRFRLRVSDRERTAQH